MEGTTGRHQVVIVGGGTAGISVAARLRRAGHTDIAVVEPSGTHYYQPMWTLVGGGLAPLASSARSQWKVMPAGVRWYREKAAEVDPDARVVTLARGQRIGYDYLVVAPGLQLNWNAIPGLDRTLGRDGVSSNYAFALAPATWTFIRDLRSGTALFTLPASPVKCGGAPLKIAFLAADYWRRTGVADDIQIVLALGTRTMFRVPAYVPILEQVAQRYGIEVRLSTELTSINPDTREAVLHDRGTGTKSELAYDFLHVTPPQSAPDWIRQGPLSSPNDPGGYLDVDSSTLRHNRYAEIFAIGDVASLPTSKTGAAIRKQAPVVAGNLHAVLSGRPQPKRYIGYTSCPIITARDKVVLAEFDYTLRPTPTIPFIDTMRERRDMYLLKRYGLPALYWHGMLRGRG